MVGRTISMQLEGSWAPVADIMVDKVGKFAYGLSAPGGSSGGDAQGTPIILDVALDSRVKARMMRYCLPEPSWLLT